MMEENLTQEEAKELYRLIQKLDKEMHSRIQGGENAFDTGEVDYTTIVRDKKRTYLETVYDIEPEELEG